MKATVYRKILDWCIIVYGKSPHFKEYPDMEVDHKESFGLLGEYESENNVIIIYDAAIFALALESKMSGRLWFFETGIKTVIHEYQHYLQDPDLSDMLHRDVNDEENPLEIEAEFVAKRDWERCYNDLFMEKK
jgi:hypothetical protein